MSEELKKIFSAAGITEIAPAEQFIRKELKALQSNGDLALGPNQNLTGFSLELRVQRLFEKAGFTVIDGRPNMEDFVIKPDDKDDPKDNLVIEVKSSRSSQPSLDDLRQLDDWVFDLSGEEKARKQGLGGGLDTLALGTHGMVTRAKRHPTPHKGILVFNGPIGTPFTNRPDEVLHPNQLDFAIKRNFCVIGIDSLKELLKKGHEAAWVALHSTVGEYKRGA